MNLDQVLIFIKGEEKTRDVASYRFDQNRCYIRYRSGKEYPFHKQNVKIETNPTSRNVKGKQLYINGKLYPNTKALYEFRAYAKRIDENDRVEIYKRPKIEVKELLFADQQSENILAYLTELSQRVGVIEDNAQNTLTAQFEALKKVPADSALRYLIKQQKLPEAKEANDIIFPFGFNLSQKAATEQALTHPLSIIEGPPGTGKTQSILSIVANCVLQGKTVAIVSNNNAATKNVVEKLEKYELDFLTAYLGNRENQKNFIAKQNLKYPDMNSWEKSHEERTRLRAKLRDAEAELNTMLTYQNERAKLRHELTELSLEQRYFENYQEESSQKTIEFRVRRTLSSKKWLRLLIELQHGNSNRFWQRVKNVFVYGIRGKDFFAASEEAQIVTIQSKYYQSKHHELEGKIDALNQKLEAFSFDKEMEIYSETSMSLFKAVLAERYRTRSQRPEFKESDVRYNMATVLKEYPVILSSTHSLRRNMPKDELFDYVLIDESSQVDVVTGALALSCAKNVVVVGDSKQLPNIVTTENKQFVSALYETYKIPKGLQYDQFSLLTALFELYPDVPSTLLKEHYRCHPQIIDFCNRKFYNNELVILSEAQDEASPLVLYRTAKGNHARHTVNRRQIDEIEQVIMPKYFESDAHETIGIIAPYRQQVQEIQRLYPETHPRVQVDTVHKFQGREKDAIILSTVADRVKAQDFVDDANLINVAVSRAVEKLIVIVSEDAKNWKHTNLGDLIDYIQHQNFEVVDSPIHSVFDLLYKDYEIERQRFLRRSRRVSEFLSENLVYDMLTGILKDELYQGLGIIVHQPLRMLIQDTSLLTPDEKKFAFNNRTHTDFVIFNKLDKQPILVVEVDGYQFHNQNSEQLKRDALKDHILAKYHVPIIRLNTTGSGEKERVSKKLDDILGR